MVIGFGGLVVVIVLKVEEDFFGVVFVCEKLVFIVVGVGCVVVWSDGVLIFVEFGE